MRVDPPGPPPAAPEPPGPLIRPSGSRALFQSLRCAIVTLIASFSNRFAPIFASPRFSISNRFDSLFALLDVSHRSFNSHTPIESSALEPCPVSHLGSSLSGSRAKGQTKSFACLYLESPLCSSCSSAIIYLRFVHGAFLFRISF